MKNTSNSIKLRLPCLKGRVGDWYYYTSTMNFYEVSKRIKLPKEIDKKYDDLNLKLGERIQRDVSSKRILPISKYLINQDERFFNSLVLGIYDGSPSWQELQIKPSDEYSKDKLTEKELIHFSETFGILTLSGLESIFAIDGQHRIMGIREAVKKEPDKFKYDEIAVVFVAHKTDEKGRKRTRRLFSTLNRYAKPVNKGEIIALSEDDNCAILTRKLIEENSYFRNRISINKNKSISQSNTKDFTSVIMLYDIVFRLLTNGNIVGYNAKCKGKDKIDYITTRRKDNILIDDYSSLVKLFDKIIKEIPALKSYFIDNIAIDRSAKNSSLLFKVIGQNVFFDILKIAINESKLSVAIDFFKIENFSLTNDIWGSIFWDKNTNKLITETSRQKYAKILIMEKLGFPIRRSPKDIEIENTFNLKL